MIQIISIPEGEAPKEVRKQWARRYLPATPFDGEIFGVRTGRSEGKTKGFRVSFRDALVALANAGPDGLIAVAWWEREYKGGGLVFPASCCEIVE